MATMLALVVISAFTTEWIGIHAIFGAFLAGVVLPRRSARNRDVVAALDPVVGALLLPVFFTLVGLSTRVDLLDRPSLWVWTVVVTVVAMGGKLGGATLAARAVGEDWSDASRIGLMLNTRGLTEVVFVTVGLQLGVIGAELFSMLVLMALITTAMTTPLLRLFRVPALR
jgi:Kef-type K+ transport system membrane component KefB